MEGVNAFVGVTQELVQSYIYDFNVHLSNILAPIINTEAGGQFV